MSDRTKIAWAQASWNVISGCTPCSPGCDHCYARRMLGRHLPGMGHDADPGTLVFHPERLEQPLHWRRPRRIFVCSMADFWHRDVRPEWQEAVFDIVDRCPQHTFLFLTKRIHSVMCSMSPGIAPQGHDLPPRPNAWLGVTVCNQAELAKLDILRRTDAALRFVSFEPLLEDVGQVHLTGISWCIVGGETGPGARPLDPDWVRSLRDQCLEAGVPFFFKQWGSCTARWGRLGATWDAEAAGCGRLGNGGAWLDGRQWKEFPR